MLAQAGDQRQKLGALLWVLLALWLAPAALAALAGERFPAGPDQVELPLPPEWQSEYLQPRGETVTTIHLYPLEGEGFRLLVTLVKASAGGSALRRRVETAAEAALAHKGDAPFAVQAVPGASSGWYFSFPTAPGTGFDWLSQGAIRVGGITLVYTLETDSAAHVPEVLAVLARARWLPAAGT
jgi:hypothetical protein